MTPEGVAHVRATAAAATRDPRFADAFYEGLFRRAPAIRPMFPASIGDQAQKFSDQLAAILRSLDDFDAFRGEASALGVRHAAYGVEARHYTIATDALIEALRATLGDAIDADTEEAWRAALDLIAEEMQAAGAGD